MSTPLSLNALLSLPKGFSVKLELGKEYTIRKSGFRIMPLEMPMEISTDDHVYLGKVVVIKLVITKEYTDVTFKVLKIFTEEESRIFSENFLRY